jgi:SAM-dependent methyltransferase
MTDAELLKELSRYHFYHIIKLTETISTPGNPEVVPAQDLCLKYLRSLDLRGKRVLDVGCRDGLFSLAAEEMGAAEVVGIDNDLSEGAVNVVIPFLKSKVRMHSLNLYDLRPDHFGLFDVVVFPGVLYHLRYPFWGLRTLREVLKVGGHLLIETAVWEGVPGSALLFCPVGEESPYERTSCTFFNEKGLVDTLSSLGFRTTDVEMLMPRYVDPSARSLQRLKTAVKELFTGHREPTPPVNRCVLCSVYEGYDKESYLGRYWEGTHNFHTLYGD